MGTIAAAVRRSAAPASSRRGKAARHSEILSPSRKASDRADDKASPKSLVQGQDSTPKAAERAQEKASPKSAARVRRRTTTMIDVLALPMTKAIKDITNERRIAIVRPAADCSARAGTLRAIEFAVERPRHGVCRYLRLAHPAESMVGRLTRTG